MKSGVMGIKKTRALTPERGSIMETLHMCFSKPGYVGPAAVIFNTFLFAYLSLVSEHTALSLLQVKVFFVLINASGVEVIFWIQCGISSCFFVNTVCKRSETLPVVVQTCCCLMLSGWMLYKHRRSISSGCDMCLSRLKQHSFIWKRNKDFKTVLRRLFMKCVI